MEAGGPASGVALVGVPEECVVGVLEQGSSGLSLWHGDSAAAVRQGCTGRWCWWRWWGGGVWFGRHPAHAGVAVRWRHLSIWSNEPVRAPPLKGWTMNSWFAVVRGL